MTPIKPPISSSVEVYYNGRPVLPSNNNQFKLYYPLGRSIPGPYISSYIPSSNIRYSY